MAKRFVYDEHGKKVGVVIKVREFEKLIDQLEDISDYEYLAKHCKRPTKVYTLEETMAGIKSRP
jgi:hypothetical protein